MQTGSVILGSSRINYSIWGTGKKPLLCFHGYGETASSFALLEDRLGTEFTIIAPDMPFHGATQWNEGLFFDPALLPGLIDKILDTQSDRANSAIRTDRWHVLGYSMGGRVALSLLELIPERIAGLILLAPDGFKLNFWYRIATQTRAGNGIFRHIMQKPRSIFVIMKVAAKLHLINPGIHKFMFRYINDPQVRKDLYNRWTVMREFKPDIRSIRSIIRERRIRVNLLYGRHDRIMRAETGEGFRKGLEPWCALHILDAGHGLLQKKFVETIAALLED